MQTASGRAAFKTWILDTVIRLRNDDEWFCFAVQALQGADGTHDYRADLAIMKFLIDNPRCSAYRDEFSRSYASERHIQISLLQDTAYDPNLRNFDTSLSSLHELGLDTLLTFASVAYYDEPGPAIIRSTSVTANPFVGETSLSVSLNREAYLRISVLDLLGKSVADAGYNGIIQPGSRTVPIHLQSQPTGTYYLRIATANNEVRTIKMVKVK